MATTDDRTESTQDKLELLQRLREEALNPATEQAVERQRSQGKLLAHERTVARMWSHASGHMRPVPHRQ